MEMGLEILKNRLVTFFENREEIIFAYLFGSLTESRLTLMSDIDIAVLIEESKIREKSHPYGYAAYLTSALMDVLKTNAVDVVLLSDAPPTLKYCILSRGIRLFSRNPKLEKEVFVNALHHYENTLPLRRVQQLYLARYLKNLGSPLGRG